jgi:hypothetical protein
LTALFFGAARRAVFSDRRVTSAPSKERPVKPGLRKAPSSRRTPNEVVFAEEGDLALLGARTLEGLNLTLNPARKKLVAAGPLPAA